MCSDHDYHHVQILGLYQTVHTCVCVWAGSAVGETQASQLQLSTCIVNSSMIYERTLRMLGAELTAETYPCLRLSDTCGTHCRPSLDQIGATRSIIMGSNTTNVNLHAEINANWDTVASSCTRGRGHHLAQVSTTTVGTRTRDTTCR